MTELMNAFIHSLICKWSKNKPIATSVNFFATCFFSKGKTMACSIDMYSRASFIAVNPSQTLPRYVKFRDVGLLIYKAAKVESRSAERRLRFDFEPKGEHVLRATFARLFILSVHKLSSHHEHTCHLLFTFEVAIETQCANEQKLCHTALSTPSSAKLALNITSVGSYTLLWKLKK